MSKYPGRIVTDLADTGYSVYFDGTGDSLTISASGVGPTGTETFCFEVWMNASNLGANFPRIFEGTATNAFQVYLAGGTLTIGQNGGSSIITYALTGLTNQWLHICVTRDSATSQIRLFVNGVLRGYNASGGTNFAASSTWRSLNESGGIVGYLSNMRVVRGSIPVAYQTSSTTTGTTIFSPPTQLFNITNTSLLTCNSPAIIDQSNNAYAITPAGDVRVTTFTPFTAYVPYNPALGASTPGVWTVDEALQAKGTRQWNMYDPRFNLTILLLHGNGTNAAQNNTFLDSSSNNFPITRNPASGPNAPTQGSFSPFSQTGWSNFFSGSTSSLRMAANTAFDQNAGSFSVECWVYPAVIQATTGLYIYGAQGNTGMLMVAYGYSTGLFKIDQGGAGGGIRITSNSTYPANTWHHVAYTYDGTTLRLFINGVLQGTATGITPIASQAVAIGEFGNSSYFNGYVSNFRICRAAIPTQYQTSSTTVGTTIFTPSTSPLTTTSQGASNVTFLTCQSNRFVDNGSAGISFTVNGTPSVQAFSPFYSTAAYTPATVGGSGYFDGSGDYLSVPASSDFTFTGNFTIECWFYPTAALSTGTSLWIMAIGAGDNFALNVGSTSSTVFLGTAGGGSFIATGNTIQNAWNHLAVVRNGSTVTLYINGNPATGTGTTSATLGSSTTTFRLGGFTGGISGYITNWRVNNGQALYTSAFTPPTSPLTTTSQNSTSTNTKLLLNFTNAGIVDSTAKNVLETVGNAQISTTQSKFGGTSMSFDGTGDYLQIPSSNLLAFGSSPYTVELWLYPNNVANLQGLFTMGAFRFFQNATGLWFLNSSTSIINVATGLSTGQWFHIALVREGTGTSQTKLYLNGSSIGTGTDANTWAAAIAYVGSEGASNQLNGYIDDLRITRFARYTGNFTPQTSQWQDE